MNLEVHYSTGISSTRSDRDFFLTNLYPTYRNVEEIINLEIVPFGLTTFTVVDGNYIFTCPTGPDECLGNRIHVSLIETKIFRFGKLFKK